MHSTACSAPHGRLPAPALFQTLIPLTQRRPTVRLLWRNLIGLLARSPALARPLRWREERVASGQPESMPAAETIADSASGSTTTMLPRSSLIQLRSSQARSCLLVLSRVMPMIWPISRWVIATLRLM